MLLTAQQRTTPKSRIGHWQPRRHQPDSIVNGRNGSKAATGALSVRADRNLTYATAKKHPSKIGFAVLGLPLTGVKRCSHWNSAAQNSVVSVNIREHS